ncbi:MAG TPA: carboxy terminal-processing peptidase, partial [Flavisolibacter sp.]
TLATASAARISSHPGFAKLKEEVAKMTAYVKTKIREVPLQPAGYEAWRVQHETLLPKEAPVSAAASAQFVVMNHGYEQQRLLANTYAGEISKVQRDDLQKDIYVEETYRIVADLIQITKLK